MDLNLSEEQQIIQRTARSFLERHAPRSLVRESEERPSQFHTALWREITGLGWTGMTVPAEYGGGGQPFVDQCVLLEEVGRALAPIPYRAVCADAVQLVSRAGSPEQRERLLGGIASGDLVVTVAMDEPGRDEFPRSIQTRAERSDGGYRLTGTKVFVPYAAHARHILCPARLPDSSIGIFVVDTGAEGVSARPIKEMFEDQNNYEVRLQGVEVAADALLGPAEQALGHLEVYQEFAAISLCSEMVGAMDQVLKDTVRYAQERVQFGRPIGSFQAVQYMCVEMLEYVEGAQHITHEAAWLLSQGRPASRIVGMAKGWVAEALGVVAQNGHQVHGAIGFTLEHDMQLYSRTMRMAEGILGDPARTADAVLARAS